MDDGTGTGVYTAESTVDPWITSYTTTTLTSADAGTSYEFYITVTTYVGSLDS